MGALDGVRVVDFSQYIAGPLLGVLLADAGASVVHVDPPGGPRWRSPANAVLMRGKALVELDLKTDEGKDAARRLVADVLACVEATGAQPVHLVGHDWGGSVAWAFAERHPERVAALTVLATPHHRALSAALRHRDQARRSWYMAAFQVPWLPELALRRSIIAQKLVPRADGKGRVVVPEILICTPTVSKAIEDGSFGDLYHLMNEGGFWGMQTMNQGLARYVKAGVIAEETALNYAGIVSELKQMLRR